MNKHQTLSKIYYAMIHLNIVIISFFTLFFFITTRKYALFYQAYNFIINLETLPIHPCKILIYVGGSFLILLIVLYIKATKMLSMEMTMVLLAFELFLCFLIMKGLYFQYKGVVLLVIANFLKTWKNLRSKVIIIVAFFLLFGISGMDALSIGNSIKFDSFLQYYQPNIRSWIHTLVGVCVSANDLLFMMYLVLLIRFQWIENERVTKLNLQLDDANEQLKNASFKLREYAKEKEKMGETKERNRLAREIHDTLGHTLTGISAGIDALKILLNINKSKAEKQLDIIGKLAREGIKDVRRSVNALRPDALERLSLKEAIIKISEEYREFADIQLKYYDEATFMNMDEEEENIVYRLIQESITNSVRHGKANIIQVSLNRHYNQLQIEIKDNGKGCDNIVEGFGLIHMQERIKRLGGQISYKSKNGFIVNARIPIRWDER